MEKIGLVTDSTAYLTAEQNARIKAAIVSLTINFEGESIPEEGLYHDFEEFYDRLRKSDTLPTTSQPSVGDFMRVYQRMAQKVDCIISIHITNGISGTVQTARSAAQLLPELDITIVDSRSAAIGEYLALDAASRAIEAEYGKDDVLRVINYVIKNTTLRFLPDTLEYLHRGGRIGGAAALFGTLLQIKPILFFNPEKNDIIDLYEKVRTREKGLHHILGDIDNVHRVCPDIKTAVVHVGTKQGAAEVISRISTSYPELITDICPVGPVVGAHIGPGTVGVACYPLTPELKQFITYRVA